MKFTDEDLKRLKATAEVLSDDKHWQQVSALLHRLECAEKIIQESFDHEGYALIGDDDWHEALRQWKYSKGESNGRA